MLQEWVSRHHLSYPPMVINITDGDTTDGDPTPHAQAVSSFSMPDGHVLVFNCHISSRAASPIMFPDSDSGLPDQFAQRLFHMSSVLPGNFRVIQFSEVGEFRVYSHLVINDFEGRWEYDRFVSSLDRSVG